MELKYSLDDMKKDMLIISKDIDNNKCINIQSYINSISVYLKCLSISDKKETVRLLEVIKKLFDDILHLASEIKIVYPDSIILDNFIIQTCLNKMTVSVYLNKI